VVGGAIILVQKAARNVRIRRIISREDVGVLCCSSQRATCLLTMMRTEETTMNVERDRTVLAYSMSNANVAVRGSWDALSSPFRAAESIGQLFAELPNVLFWTDIATRQLAFLGEGQTR